MLRRLIYLFLATALLVSLLGGCSLFGGKSVTTPPTQAAKAAPPRGTTGTIATGKTVAAASAKVSSSGGTLAVSQPGTPITGMELTVPAKAYTGTKTFEISYAPIEKHSFGDNFNPLTPLISIDNGGEYAEEIMTVKIPVTVPADSFAMGFIYDQKTKTLSGLPTLAQTDTSITVGTRHFTDFLSRMIPLSILKRDIDSSFRPGIDDWQFTNYGSYIAKGGHCAGQSVTALWYYVTQPDGKDLTLYGRYDNNGDKPATPDLWPDDSQGYRFVSTVHQDINWQSFENKFWTNLAGVNDDWTWKLFAYSMQITGEPQEVGIYSNAGGAHDMICYRVKDGNLYIADPNYPGNTERRIEYKNGKFVPYNSGANREEIDAGNGKAYEKIEYCAKTTTVSWDKIAQRWAEFKAGTIGKGIFPDYQIVWVDEKNQYHELIDGYVSPSKLINIGPVSKSAALAQADIIIRTYRDGKALNFDAKGNYELMPGVNKLGIEIVGKVDSKDKNGNPIKVQKYVDFKYINVVFNAEATKLSISPDSVTLEPGQPQVLTVTSSKPPVKPSYEWLMGSISLNIKAASVKTGTDKTYTFNATNPGTYEVSVQEWDEGVSPRKLTGGIATCIIDVKAKSASKLPLLQKTLGIQLGLTGSHTYKVWQAPNNTTTQIKETAISCPQSISGEIRSMPISWNGTNFSGKFSYGPVDNQVVYTVSGSVSADGETLTNLTYSWVRKSKGTNSYSDQTVKIAVAGIPIWNPISGAGVSKFITSISDVYTNHYTGGEKRDDIQYVSSDWTKGKISLNFVSQLDSFVTGSNGNFYPK